MNFILLTHFPKKLSVLTFVDRCQNISQQKATSCVNSKPTQFCRYFAFYSTVGILSNSFTASVCHIKLNKWTRYKYLHCFYQDVKLSNKVSFADEKVDGVSVQHQLKEKGFSVAHPQEPRQEISPSDFTLCYLLPRQYLFTPSTQCSHSLSADELRVYLCQTAKYFDCNTGLWTKASEECWHRTNNAEQLA